MATRGLEYRRDPRPRLDRGRRAHASSPDDRGPRFRTWAGTRLDSAAARPVRRPELASSGPHAYFIHSYAFPPNDRRRVATIDYGGPVAAAVAQRQRRRHAVPPREEPGARACPARQFPGVATMILFPAIDLKDGQCVRLCAATWTSATVFNADPAAQARAVRSAGLPLDPRRRSERRGAGKPVNRAPSRRSWGRHHPGAARRRHPQPGDDRRLARGRRQPGDPRHRRGQRSGAVQAAARNSRQIAVGIDARAARSPPRAGPRPRTWTPSPGAALRGRRRRRPDHHRHRPRRHGMGFNVDAFGPSPTRWRFP